ncbi:S1 family peptidase [Roseateles koreensis]|uniref:Serine protease n=1 Tax=Roseateles koreensis TaxID=2987526 RepID=A0ABT5KUS5_9BURK|nr:serine protease [Roseateles koreensis]MDC8786185.1 serine protease [Roseateles koreensis]
MNLTRRMLVLAAAVTAVGSSYGADRAAGEGGSLPALIRNARPSVLLIGTYGETDSPRFLFRGTGFVVAPNNLAITNAHVLPDVLEDDPSPRRLIVQTASPGATSNKWTQREVQVLKIDREHDLALLKVDGPAIPVLPLANDQLAQEGASVAFMGFPIGGALGFSLVTHRGTISSIAPIALPQAGAQALNEKFIRQLRQGTFNILQLDATAYPGNSGGPVFDLNTGAVVGVINMVLIKGARETALSHPSGISYAIPVESVKRLLVRPE